MFSSREKENVESNFETLKIAHKKLICHFPKKSIKFDGDKSK